MRFLVLRPGSPVSIEAREAPSRKARGARYREYLSDEQRRGAGCIARRMQRDSRTRHGIHRPARSLHFLRQTRAAARATGGSC